MGWRMSHAIVEGSGSILSTWEVFNVCVPKSRHRGVVAFHLHLESGHRAWYQIRVHELSSTMP